MSPRAYLGSNIIRVMLQILGDPYWRNADVNVLGVAAAEAVARSIVGAVEMAPTLGGVPGLKL
jgi:hypothetical protein